MSKKVLIACEESQVVTLEMRKIGIEAYSCDILETSGNNPEWHIKGDVTPLLEEHWDLIIAFPPCTHLASSGARWFKQKREDGRQEKAINFFMKFVKSDCDKIAIENPIGIMSSIYRKPDQIIQPYQFGHGETKATCLWLKNLPKLKIREENLVEGRFPYVISLPPSKDRAKLRSKTYPGIAKAMALDWGLPLLEEKQI